jgi:hypothetical protein
LKKNKQCDLNEPQECDLKETKESELIEIVSKINEDPGLVRIEKTSGKDQTVLRDWENLIKQLKMGNKSPGIGNTSLFKGIKEARTKNGARIYFREKGGKIEILAKSNKKAQPQVIKIKKKNTNKKC